LAAVIGLFDHYQFLDENLGEMQIDSGTTIAVVMIRK
jgi:hypothetical protein